MVNPIPDNYPRICPNIAVAGANDAIAWYCEVFDMTERMRMPMPDGTVAHAELQVGDAVLMVADAQPDAGFADPTSVGGTPVVLSLYVADVDAIYATATGRGAEGVRPPEDQFWGDRSATLIDPWGHQWNIASVIEDVSMEEMEQRMSQMGG